MKTLAAFFVAAACLFAPQLVAGELPTFKEASLPCEELPLNVQPYKAYFYLTFPSCKSDEFKGEVSYLVNFQKFNADIIAKSNQKDCMLAPPYGENTIVLHADKSLKIEDIKVFSDKSLTCISGCKLKQRKIVELIRDESKQMIAIKVKRGMGTSIADTQGNIVIKFKGQISKDKLREHSSADCSADQVLEYVESQIEKSKRVWISENYKSKLRQPDLP